MNSCSDAVTEERNQVSHPYTLLREKKARGRGGETRESGKTHPVDEDLRDRPLTVDFSDMLLDKGSIIPLIEFDDFV